MRKGKLLNNKLVASNEKASISSQVDELLAKIGDSNFEWVLIVQDKIFPCDATGHNSREELIGDIGNALACNCLIAAVVHHGQRLLHDEIEALKSDAISGLGPISKARAKGFF